MAKTTRPPLEIVTSIKNESANVRKAAGELTDRIAKFRGYLSKLKGRVETEVYGQHPDQDGRDNYPIQLALKLHRIDNKEWELSYGIDTDALLPPAEWHPLVEAPLKLKIAAIKLFPDLLESIEKSQSRLTGEIDKASRDFDKFAEGLDIPEDVETSTTLIVKGKRVILTDDTLEGDADPKEQWKAVMTLLAHQGPEMTGLLENARLRKIEDGCAVVRFTGNHRSFVKELERGGRKEQIRAAFAKLMGEQTTVRFEVYDPANPSLLPRIVGEPAKEGT